MLAAPTTHAFRPLSRPQVDAYAVFEPASAAPAAGAPPRTLASYLAAAGVADAPLGSASASSSSSSPASFRNAIVYVVGGACYSEEADVAAWAAGGGGGGAAPPQRTVVYAGTDMVSPAGFLAQLRALGEQTAAAQTR